MKEILEFTPEGWIEGISVGGVSYCGKADPGISWRIITRSGQRLGGCITIETAEALFSHLEKAIPECKNAPTYEQAYMKKK